MYIYIWLLPGKYAGSCKPIRITFTFLAYWICLLPNKSNLASLTSKQEYVEHPIVPSPYW